MKTLFSAILYLFLVLYITLTLLKGALEIPSPGEQGKGVFSVLFKGIHFSARQTTAQRFLCCGRGRRRKRVAHLYRGCCLSESRAQLLGHLRAVAIFNYNTEKKHGCLQDCTVRTVKIYPQIGTSE